MAQNRAPTCLTLRKVRQDRTHPTDLQDLAYRTDRKDPMHLGTPKVPVALALLVDRVSLLLAASVRTALGQLRHWERSRSPAEAGLPSIPPQQGAPP